MGRGWGVRIQIGRTSIVPHRWLPYRWEIESSLMNPKEYGFGFWITRDLWADSHTHEEAGNG